MVVSTALWDKIRMRLRSVQSYTQVAFALVFSVAVLGAMIEGALQFNESRQESALAWRIVNDAHAQDPRSRVLALRDYIRRHVSYHGAPIETRPFLRATALETLRSGLGWCGDVSRTFIVLARAMGIDTQRIDLDGSHTHVVAEADIGLSETVVVDSQNPPHVPDLEPLSVTLRRPEYTTYYTLNLRRLHLGAVTHLRIEMGFLTYWTENPHALKALLWGVLAAILVSAKGVRWSLRRFLVRRGWVHRGTVQEGVSPVG
jgi:hypothetical protein